MTETPRSTMRASRQIPCGTGHLRHDDSNGYINRHTEFVAPLVHVVFVVL